MTRYMVQRSIYLLFLLWMVTIVTFVVIQLPPGDYLSTYISRLEQQAGDVITEEMIQALKAQYGLDLPMHERYLKWLGSVFRGDFGFSYEWQKPVGELIRERLALSFTVAILSTLVTYAIAIPIGIYSATHQYSLGDYVITVWGFLGLAIPNFMLALVFLFLAFKLFGANLSGLFSPEYIDAPWSTAKVIDMLKHLPIPILVLSTSGAAGLIRVLRATLLDELQKQYVITARAKGVSETRSCSSILCGWL